MCVFKTIIESALVRVASYQQQLDTIMSTAVLDAQTPNDSTWYVSRPLSVGNITALLVCGTGDERRDALACPGGTCCHSVILRTSRGDYMHPQKLDSYTVFALKKHLHAVFEDERVFHHLVKCSDSFATAGIVDCDRMRFAETLCDKAEEQFGFTPRPQLTETERALIDRLRRNTPWCLSATLSNVYQTTRAHVLDIFGPSPVHPTVERAAVELPVDNAPARVPQHNEPGKTQSIESMSHDALQALLSPETTNLPKRVRKPVERYKPTRTSTKPRAKIMK